MAHVAFWPISICFTLTRGARKLGWGSRWQKLFSVWHVQTLGYVEGTRWAIYKLSDMPGERTLIVRANIQLYNSAIVIVDTVCTNVNGEMPDIHSGVWHSRWTEQLIEYICWEQVAVSRKMMNALVWKWRQMKDILQ